MQSVIIDEIYEVWQTANVEEVVLPPFAFDVFLYLQPTHVALQAGPDWQMFVLINRKTNRVDGLAHFFKTEKNVYSPWRAPFGGVQFQSEVPKTVLYEFLEYLHQIFVLTKISNVQWLQCPDAYAPATNQTLREVLVTSLHYSLKHNQLNHHIPVSETLFSVHTHASIRRRLAKCLQVGFTFHQETIHQLPEAYSFIKHCRDEKGKRLSLSLSQLTQYFNLFPDRYFLFTVRKGEELAAVGVAVLVTSQILNHLYPASPRSFNKYSPSILLNAGLYNYCQQHNISMLDLGVSVPIDEQEDAYHGLITFKQRLGGVKSWKPTYEWIE